ncbi:MAG: efflux RND transporter periplasmic adaptor subunit [Planctomycetes bacterium]|nr:efflux RND transporter periplasmic adaptor subunit [Planctomycetota bacterium]
MNARYCRPLATSLAVSLLVLGWGCSFEGSAEAEELSGAKAREAVRVVTEPLVQREVVRKLETATRVESESLVQVFPRASGVVTALSVEEGDVIAAGAVLAQLDDRDARLRLDDARAQQVDAEANRPKLALAVREAQARLDAAQRSAEQARRDHERNLALSAGGGDRPALISSKDLEASELAQDRSLADVGQNALALERARVEEQNGETALARTRVAVERAELELSYTRIVAPVAGVIAERSIKVGDTLSPSTLCFALTDPERLRAVFFRPQRELEMFRAALKGATVPAGAVAELAVRASAEAMPGKEFRGTIERVAPTIDAASGNFRVTARMQPAALSDAAARLLPGMLVRLEIVTDRHANALVAPKRAVRREGDRSTIFVVEGNRARAVEIEEGFSDENGVEVIARAGATLTAGMRVVVVGNRDLEDGAEVATPETAR